MMVDDDYADLIYYYFQNPTRLERFTNAYIHFMNEAYAIVHIPVTEISMNAISIYGYSAMPALYGLTSMVSLDASKVTNIRNIPSINLRGSNTLIGIIDTGIDYLNSLFLKPDGTTKIAAIWDQTIHTGPSPFDTRFGTEYTMEQINQALNSENPLEIIPSIDENGHGTMLAGIAAGNDDTKRNFSGVAPDAELLIVKLRKAKKYLMDFYLVSEDVLCYQENHIMWGVQYCLQKAKELNKPLVLCIGLGSSQGPHNGRTPLSNLLSIAGDLPRTAVIVSAGNEGSMGRHYYGTISPTLGYDTVELNVGEEDHSFTMELWGNSPGIYSIDILSPSGEYIPRIPANLKVNREISFIFERTIINVDYLMTESETGDQLIMLRFRNISPGSWRFNVYGQSDLPLSFHIWLPMGNMISKSTYFLKPDMYTTILSPGSAPVPITVTAYNPTNNILYVNSSRGFSRNNDIKPVIAAPGVNYFTPNNQKDFATYSGTGVAAAHTAGIAALLMEWAVSRGNRPNIDTIEMKNYLISGAVRLSNTTYPNRDWGYGILNLMNVFEMFRSE